MQMTTWRLTSCLNVNPEVFGQRDSDEVLTTALETILVGTLCLV